MESDEISLSITVPSFKSVDPLPPTTMQVDLLKKMLRMDILYGKEEGIAYLTRDEANELICYGAKRL